MVASGPGSARAFEGVTLEARGGVGLGAMLTPEQRENGFRTGFVPELRPGLRFDDDFAAELALASWFFPRDGGIGRATLFGGGLRWDPRLTSWLSFFVDGHAGVALTGDNNRFMVDGGTGFEVWLGRSLALGPFVRYGQVVDGGPDPRFWAAGLSATMLWPSDSDEPPSLGSGPGDRDRDERQRQWERSQQAEKRSPRQRDGDGDGVVDEHDICPHERPGPRPDPNMPGCPRKDTDRTDRARLAQVEVDRDGDGIPDKDDKCPSRPFGPSPDPFAIGCPMGDGDQVSIDRGTIRLSRPIVFAANGDHILPSSFPTLQALASVLKSRPAIRRVSVEAHTDAALSARQNLELSERRAEGVRRWLVSSGVEADRLVARGHGDTRPVASNRTARGRAANARLELIIVDPAGGAGLPP